MYGLNRSLGVTVHSIEKKILQPLRSMAEELHCHAAFNVTASAEFSSKRSGESLSRIADDQQDLLPGFQIQLVDQDEFDAGFDLAGALAPGDHYQDDGGSVLNMMRALHALKKCYDSIPAHARESFPTIFVRPDLDIIDDLDIEFLLFHSSGNAIVVPGWQFFGGVNDRFAVAAAGDAMGRSQSALVRIRKDPAPQRISMAAKTSAAHPIQSVARPRRKALAVRQPPARSGLHGAVRSHLHPSGSDRLPALGFHLRGFHSALGVLLGSMMVQPGVVAEESGPAQHPPPIPRPVRQGAAPRSPNSCVPQVLQHPPAIVIHIGRCVHIGR